MRTGKISENILKRSVIKPIKFKNSEFIRTGAFPSGDASVTVYGTIISSASAGLMFDEEMLWFDIKRALISGMNNVGVAGGVPKAVNIEMTLPRKAQEPNIKEYMRYISGLCQELKLEIAGGNTEVTNNVINPIITFTVYGDSVKEVVDSCSLDRVESYAGYDVLMIGDVAMSGTAAITKLKRDELELRFQKSYIELAESCENSMGIYKEATICKELGINIMHDLSRGGIYSAIWELSERVGNGVEVNLDRIPIRQESIEMCEVYNLNPYKLISNGAFLFVCENGDLIKEKLLEKNIVAHIVGKVRDDNDKVILKNEEKRFIEPPKGDQLYELISL